MASTRALPSVRQLPVILVALVVAAACGARTDPGGRRDGSVDEDASIARDASLDAPTDVRADRTPPKDAAACCGSLLLNETQTPGGCVQGAAFLAFAIEASCSAPVQRIDVHTSAKQIAVLSDAGSGPGAILIAPTATFASDPGWFSIAPTGLVLQQGERYFLAIGGSGTPCDYANQGEPVEYWGNFDGTLKTFEGPYFEPYVARVIAACK